jgi:phosphonate transport system ATP-binding protein
MLLDGLAREHQFTFVCSLHDLALAREFFPRLIGLRAGRVVFDAAPERISESDYVELYRLAHRRGDDEDD